MLKEDNLDCYFNAAGNLGKINLQYNRFDPQKNKSNKIINTINNECETEKTLLHYEMLNKKKENKIEKNHNDSDNKEDSVSESQFDDDETWLNFNISNRKYLPPPFSKKCYLIPKVFSASLSIKKNKLDTTLRALDFGISEMIQFKTKFPQSLSYSRICQETPPYLSPIFVSLLQELENFVPPLYLMTSGSSIETLESADALLDIMLRVNLNQGIPKHIENIFLFNVPVRVLTNTLQILLQRLIYPLFLATAEFCKLATSNVFDIKLIRFGCVNFNRDNILIQALGRCLAISSNFQVANLAYLIEVCQRWMREQIKCELDKNPMGSSEIIYEEAAATLSMIFGKTIVGVPKHFVAHKIINSSLPIIDDMRRTIFYFLLGIPSFEFWHLWSITTLCFEDNRLKCKCKRGAFMNLDPLNYNLESTPYL